MDKEQESKELKAGVLHYVAYAVLLVALGVFGYLYVDASNQIESQRDMVQKTPKFRDLPLDVQAEYRTVDEYKSLEMRLEKLEEKNRELAVQNRELAMQKRDVELSPKVEEPVDRALEDLEEIPKDAKLIEEFASCYDMEMGSYIISWECKKNIVSFVDKHREASYFEIISLVDDTEFSLYRSLQNNDFIYEMLGTTQRSIDKMKKLSQAGLAKHRAVEANWVIKAHTNREAKAYSANYHLVSHDGKRGVLVRAYE